MFGPEVTGAETLGSEISNQGGLEHPANHLASSHASFVSTTDNLGGGSWAGNCSRPMREAERLGQEGSFDLWMPTLGHWAELGLAAWLLGSFLPPKKWLD